MSRLLLDSAAVIALLPYGDGYRFVDEAAVMPTEHRIITKKFFAADHPIIRNHMLGDEAVVPGAVLIEQAAQSAFLLGRHTGRVGCSNRVLLGRCKAEFERPVICPALVEVDLAISVLRQEAIGFAATLSAEGVRRARVAGVCAILERSATTQ